MGENHEQKGLMKMKKHLNLKYLVIFIIFFTLETLIAIFIHDTIIRPYIGDILVIVLVYSFIRIFLKKKIKLLPVYVFLFAAIVELSQYFNLVEVLHLNKNKVLSIMLGSTFDIKDIICYFLGMILVFLYQSIHFKESNI
jgi:hypothetical protein